MATPTDDSATSNAAASTLTIFETSVASSSDDAEERSWGSMKLTSSDLDMIQDGSNLQTVGIRFMGIDIPQGAVITNAYIQFQADEVSTGAASLLIRGEDIDSAATFTNVSNNITSRANTDASVDWAPQDWTSRGEAGPAQRTPDLATVVQEIVNRSGWQALNDMVFIISGSGARTAESFDGAAAPLLHIEWLPPGPVSDPVVFNLPPDADAAANQIGELAAAGTAVGITASADDPDTGDTVTYSLDDPRFDIDAQTGAVTRSATGALDFETEPSISLTVTATSSDGSAATSTYSLSVLDEAEPVAFHNPADADSSPNRVNADAAAGTAVGITASADDPDTGDTVTYSLDDPRFAIDAQTGVVTRSATGALDPQAEPIITLNVTATSSDGTTDSQAFDVSVQEEMPQPLFRFAVFGDFGDSNLTGEQAVSDLVHNWNVDFILTAGDNAYGAVTYDQSVGQFYSDYLGNESGSTINRFFPLLGNHDYEDPGAGLNAYLSYFTLPDNERYYDFQVGSVHFFALNSYGGEPDGNNVGDPQADWLQAALAASDAAFNVVYFHDSAYVSDGGGDTDMRWPYELWGADVTFAGDVHDFDLVLRDDNGDGVPLPYVTTGRGGSGRNPPETGANLVAVTSSGILIEYYTVDGALWGSYAVDLPADADPLLFVNGDDTMNGTAGDDYLWGLGGNDTLTGFAGNDILIGGNGNDLFVIGPGDGQDTIPDFVPGAGTDDRLDLTAFNIGTASAFQQVATNQGPNTVVDLGGGDRITLLGVQVDQFHDNDFVPLGPVSDPVVFNLPPDADAAANQIGELAAAGTAVGITASADDPDTGDTVTYSLDDPRFDIDAQTGAVTRSATGALDFETEPSISLTVTATSSDGSAATSTYSLSVIDEAEPVAFHNPADADSSPNRVNADAAAGTAVGITASADDPDTGDTVTYSLDDPRFAIDAQTGVVTRSATGALDPQAEPIITLNVTATSSDGTTDSQAFDVSVISNQQLTIFETSVASSSDDAEERSWGSMKLTSSDLDMIQDGSNLQTVGIRFMGIDIPQGAVITNAYIQFQADEVSTGAASLLIRGEDIDSAATFTNVSNNITSRANTDASVDWAPQDWTSRGEAGPAQRTPDLATVVQEIVNRSGWQALNDMVFIISGSGARTAESFDGAAAPLLHIEWLPPGPVSDPVVFNLPPDADAAANQIGELAAAGTAVGITASADDPDTGDTVTYSLDDPRFDIDAQTGAVTRSATGALDFETEPSISLTVTATSSDGSAATSTYSLSVLDEAEPVAFHNPADADSSPNRVNADAAAGTAVGITASADDPDTGDTVTYSLDDPRFAIDAQTGVVTRSATGALDPQAEPIITLNVTATSSDGTTDSQAFDVSVTTTQMPTSAVLVNVVQTWQWSPPSSDPAGIVYIPSLGTLLVSDSEVNEIPAIFTGDNLFEMTLGGSLVRTATTINFSDEPTGIDYNPNNGHLFFTDDTGTRAVYEVDPGADGLHGTSDDIVTSFTTRAFGLADAEGVAYDTTRGVLHLVGGAEGKVFTVDPGPNGVFDGVASEGGDDVVTSFDTGPLGVSDAEGIEYDPLFDILYIIASSSTVAMVTPTGELLGTLDISAADARHPAGLALAPSSQDPFSTSLYIVDRNGDNVNDGAVYEFMLQDWPIV